MELSEKIKFCAICKNSKRDMQRGIVCGLTNEKPTFDEHCDNLQASSEDLSALNGNTKQKGKSHCATINAIAIAILAVLGTVYFLNLKKTEGPAATPDNRDAISAIIDSISGTLPIKLNDKESLDSIKLKKKYVKISISVADTYIQFYTDDKQICEAKWRHCEMLKNLKNANRELLQLCIKDSLQIRYTFYESTKLPLYSIVAHPSDMTNAIENDQPFRCPHKDFDRVIKSEKKALPYDIVNKIQISGINMDYRTNTLNIKMRTRRKSINSQSDYEKIVKTEIWPEMAENYAVKMAMLNEGTIDFRFIGTDDKLKYSITLEPDFYNK